jgi:hypothetical protein
MLGWALMEVVRTELIAVASEQLTIVSAPEPPADRSLDVRQLVRLAVNDDGDAEWSLVGGPSPRTTAIKPAADREER